MSNVSRRKGGGHGSMPMMGISALMVIFAVLCLTVFAILSVSTVKADKALADKAVNQTREYYAADGQAEIILAQLRLGEVPEGVTEAGRDEEGRTVYRYTCPLSDAQSINIEAAVGGGAHEGDYEILKWQLVSTADWQADDNLNVWDGE